MTITNENFKNVYVLNSSTTAFPYTFKIFDDTDLLVKRYDSTTGVFTTLTLTTDYTVSGAGDAAGGTVTYSGASAYDSDYQLVITSDIANTQDTDLLNNDYSADFNETLEETFDRLCRMIQQLKEVVDRSVVLNATETTGATFPSASANALIGWNSGATALENKTMMDANAQAAAEAAAASAEEDAATAEQAAIDAVIAKEAAELIADLEVASEADAQAGTDNDKMMTPLRTFQGVAAYAAANFLTTPEEAPDADYEVANVKYVDDTVEDSVETDGVYDSGWFAIATASTIIKTHNLGTTKVVPMFWLSQSSDGSNAYSSFTWSENSVIFGSMLKNLTTTSITFQGGKDRPAGSLNDSGQDVTYTSGYARIVLIALK